MENKLIEIFKKAKYKPAPEMVDKVYRAIALRERRSTRLKLWIFTLISLVSFGGLFPTVSSLFRDLSRSGLYEYFSLIFGEGWSILSYWKELVFSLAQSLPTTSIILTLSLVFVFFLSLRYLFKEVGKNQLLTFSTLSI